MRASLRVALCACVLLCGNPFSSEARPFSALGAGKPADQDSSDRSWFPFGRQQQADPRVMPLIPGMRRGETDSFERIIRLSYELTREYGRAEGHEIRFDLAEFETTFVPAAKSLKYGDLITLGPSKRINMMGVVRRENVDGHITSERHGFAMEWERVPPLEDRETWAGRTLGEVIEIAKPLQPELLRLQAVTTYKVKVTFEGVQLDYRAAFLWMRSDTGSEVDRFGAFEAIAPRVGLVLLEGKPPESAKPQAPDPSQAPNALLEQPIGFGSCKVSTSYLYTPFWESIGRERHLTGYYHRGAEQWDISCNCSSYCQSVCHPSLGFAVCQDLGGTTGGFHVGATSFVPESGTIQDARGAMGASCSGVYGCGFAQCVVPNCLFQVQVNSAGGFSSTPAGSAFWAFSPVTRGTCGGCEETEPPTIPLPEPPKEDCPVLVALRPGHLDLTDLAGGARFDLDVDGSRERLSWPASDSDWGFVVLDRNHNGRIDNGLELFGNHSPQNGDSNHRNGYLALGEHDKLEHGGNGDGVLDAKDPIFDSLLLWVDKNHDGESQPAELSPLREHVETLGLEFKESRSRDRFGNMYRYRGDVWLVGGRRSHSVDVYLLND